MSLCCLWHFGNTVMYFFMGGPVISFFASWKSMCLTVMKTYSEVLFWNSVVTILLVTIWLNRRGKKPKKAGVFPMFWCNWMRSDVFKRKKTTTKTPKTNKPAVKIKGIYLLVRNTCIGKEQELFCPHFEQQAISWPLLRISSCSTNRSGTYMKVSEMGGC